MLFDVNIIWLFAVRLVLLNNEQQFNISIEELFERLNSSFTDKLDQVYLLKEKDRENIR